MSESLSLELLSLVLVLLIRSVSFLFWIGNVGYLVSPVMSPDAIFALICRYDQHLHSFSYEIPPDVFSWIIFGIWIIYPHMFLNVEMS